MSDTSKKKKKNNLKSKKVKRKINNNNNIKEKALTVDIPLIKPTHQLLSSINSELDDLSNNIKFNNIFKKAFPSNNELNILSFPLLAYNNNYNSNFNYDKEDFEIKELINKANFYLSNNNLNKQFKIMKIKFVKQIIIIFPDLIIFLIKIMNIMVSII